MHIVELFSILCVYIYQCSIVICHVCNFVVYSQEVSVILENIEGQCGAFGELMLPPCVQPKSSSFLEEENLIFLEMNKQHVNLL